jgi:hypothetical protein
MNFDIGLHIDGRRVHQAARFALDIGNVTFQDFQIFVATSRL